MTTTITLKNIPDDIYACLKQVAKAHHRSLNNEIIACLESVLMPKKIDTNSTIERIRGIRKNLHTKEFDEQQINQAIDDGRK
ncbi:MAG: hypothetical protein RLZZ210_732 [Pseudomonadota bacterium]|jgi:plasmid stability protein